MTTTNDSATVAIDHTIGSHGRLIVKLASAEVRLVGGDGDRVVVRTPAGRSLPDRVKIEPADDGLVIRERDALGLTFALNRRTVQLEIAVPAMAEVSIDIASGWIDAIGLTGEQRYRGVSGELRLRDGAGDIELNTVSGDATIDLAGMTDLRIRSVSGDVVVRDGTLGALRIGTTSGDVRVDSPLVGRTGNTIETLSGDVSLVAASGMRVEARTVSGDIQSDLPHRSEGRMGRRTLVVGDGSIEVGFKSVSGDLRIRNSAGRSGRGQDPRPAPPQEPFGPASFSIDLPEMPEMPEMPAMPALPALPTLPKMPTLPGLADLLRRAAPPATPGDEAGAARADPAIEADGVVAPMAPSGPASEAPSDGVEADRMAILRALENGELDVPTAMDRLAAIDAADGEPRDG